MAGSLIVRIVCQVGAGKGEEEGGQQWYEEGRGKGNKHKQGSDVGIK